MHAILARTSQYAVASLLEHQQVALGKQARVIDIVMQLTKQRCGTKSPELHYVVYTGTLTAHVTTPPGAR